MFDFSLLQRLCEARGISGDEGAVRDLIIDEIKDHAEYRVDNLGNLLVHKKGKAPAKARLMLSAHMDEVGLMVTDITSEGFKTISRTAFGRSGSVAVFGNFHTACRSDKCRGR